jgi:Xaa-Pro aminopeptidase
MKRRLFLLVVVAGCSSPPAQTQPAVAPEDLSIPKPVPRGPLTSPNPVAQKEARGLVGPTGTFGVETYRKRRRAVMDRMGKGAALVLNEGKWEGGRSRMDFYYLTGIEEDGAGLLLNPLAPSFKEVLYLKRMDVEGERWVGERAMLPSRELEVATGIARIAREGGLLAGLVSMCARDGNLIYLGEFSAGERPRVMQLYSQALERTYGCKVTDLHNTIARMREAKEPEELELMKKAIAYSAAGHFAALKAVRTGAREYQVKDVIEDAFRNAGSRHVAYDSITGSGPNGAVLHYPKDDRVMSAGETIVIDAAAEAELYAADITRTLPIGGKFSREQREIYEIVLRAQKAGIAAARAGVTVEQIHLATQKVIADAGYYDYYIHSCCHFVGLEVHDAGDYAAPLPVGAVITVEPGIYLPQQGFGVRIEDEILITQNGAELLSAAIPRDPDEIERLMAEAQK